MPVVLQWMVMVRPAQASWSTILLQSVILELIFIELYISRRILSHIYLQALWTEFYEYRSKRSSSYVD